LKPAWGNSSQKYTKKGWWSAQGVGTEEFKPQYGSKQKSLHFFCNFSLTMANNLFSQLQNGKDNVYLGVIMFTGENPKQYFARKVT
jgi:hypothetical protein